MTFEINGKFDTGRFFLSIYRYLKFSSKAVERMRAVLSDLGIIESPNDIFTISVIRGTNSAMHSFRSQVGNGSSSQDLTSDS